MRSGEYERHLPDCEDYIRRHEPPPEVARADDADFGDSVVPMRPRHPRPSPDRTPGGQNIGNG